MRYCGVKETLSFFLLLGGRDPHQVREERNKETVYSLSKALPSYHSLTDCLSNHVGRDSFTVGQQCEWLGRVFTPEYPSIRV